MWMLWLAGMPINLVFELSPKTAKPAKTEPTIARPNRQQRMREIESNAFVKSCIELFDAEIVRIDRPE